jgi:hypothetical protein
MHIRTKSIAQIGIALAFIFLVSGLLHQELCSLLKCAAYCWRPEPWQTNTDVNIINVFFYSFTKSGGLLATTISASVGIYLAKKLVR